jgi:hypothetical protein
MRLLLASFIVLPLDDVCDQFLRAFSFNPRRSFGNINVLDPGKGVCADPVNGGAILEKGGPDPHSRDRERQLAPDKGRGKT